MARHDNATVLAAMHQPLARIQMQPAPVIQSRVTTVTIRLENRLHVLGVILRRCLSRWSALDSFRTACEKGGSGSSRNSQSDNNKAARSDGSEHAKYGSFLRL